MASAAAAGPARRLTFRRIARTQRHQIDRRPFALVAARPAAQHAGQRMHLVAPRMAWSSIGEGSAGPHRELKRREAIKKRK
jgi:hypothetical protein